MATTLATTLGLTSSFAQPSQAALPAEKTKVLCDEACEADLEKLELVTLPSGLQYREIEPGTGAVPPVGFQVVVDYVAYTDKGRVFDSSLEKGKPYDIRVGAGQVIPGLDEGLRTMRTGSFRRLYIPGNMAFPQPLKAAAGRPSVPAKSPVIFDVKLLYVPGVDEE